jgi:hypothetical protein
MDSEDAMDAAAGKDRLPPIPFRPVPLVHSGPDAAHAVAASVDPPRLEGPWN